MGFQALPDHLDREEKKDPGGEGERKEELERKVTKESWDILGEAASKALWALLE